MLNTNPTPWQQYWNRDACVEKRERQKDNGYFMICKPGAPMIWTPMYKLAYLKTPKAASTAFWYFFKEHFPDSEEINPAQLPDDAYVFTFVRQPFEQKLSGFAEVDLKTQAGLEKDLDSSTTFQHVLPSVSHGRARFSAFLDDIWHHRFQQDDKRRPSHAANQVGAPLCTHKTDYIGHLERLTADWDEIQRQANLPVAVRTKALPIIHADTSDKHQRYLYDESVPMNVELKEKMCEIFRSEFACLGYTSPKSCAKFGVER